MTYLGEVRACEAVVDVEPDVFLDAGDRPRRRRLDDVIAIDRPCRRRRAVDDVRLDGRRWQRTAIRLDVVVMNGSLGRRPTPPPRRRTRGGRTAGGEDDTEELRRRRPHAAAAA